MTNEAIRDLMGAMVVRLDAIVGRLSGKGVCDLNSHRDYLMSCCMLATSKQFSNLLGSAFEWEGRFQIKAFNKNYIENSAGGLEPGVKLKILLR